MHCLCGDKAGAEEGNEKDKESDRGMKDQMIWVLFLALFFQESFA